MSVDYLKARALLRAFARRMGGDVADIQITAGTGLVVATITWQGASLTISEATTQAAAATRARLGL